MEAFEPKERSLEFVTSVCWELASANLSVSSVLPPWKVDAGAFDKILPAQTY